MEKRWDEEQIGKNPCGWACKADCVKAESGNDQKAHESACSHLTHTCQHRKARISHALNQKTDDIDECERKIEQCVDAQEAVCHRHDPGIFRMQEQQKQISATKEHEDQGDHGVGRA